MIVIISDIHGNYEALKRVLSETDKNFIDEIYCLGDIVGYYTQINECCDELRTRNVKCIMGNHDWYMVSGSFCPRSKSVNDCLEYQKKIITKENKEWLSTLPIMRNINGISMVHGGWLNPLDEYLKPSEEYFKKLDGKIFVSGHSHVQQIHNFNYKIYCNPGSIGQPRDGDNRASYATYDGNSFELHRVSYDINKVCNLMDEAGFSSYYYRCLSDASPNLHN